MPRASGLFYAGGFCLTVGAATCRPGENEAAMENKTAARTLPLQYSVSVTYGRQIAAPTSDCAGGLPLEGKLAAEFKRRLTDEVSKPLTDQLLS